MTFTWGRSRWIDFIDPEIPSMPYSLANASTSPAPRTTRNRVKSWPVRAIGLGDD